MLLPAKFADPHGTPLLFTPDEFSAFVKAQTEKWANVVNFSGAKRE